MMHDSDGVDMEYTLRHERAAAEGGDPGAIRKPEIVTLPSTTEQHITPEWLDQHYEWSEATFGKGERSKGLVANIQSELEEIEKDPHDIFEWCDVILLALDGAARHGHSSKRIIAALREKDRLNTRRKWPSPTGEDKPIFHLEPAPIPAEKLKQTPREALRFALDGVDVSGHTGYSMVRNSDLRALLDEAGEMHNACADQAVLREKAEAEVARLKADRDDLAERLDERYDQLSIARGDLYEEHQRAEKAEAEARGLRERVGKALHDLDGTLSFSEKNAMKAKTQAQCMQITHDRFVSDLRILRNESVREN